MFNNNEFEFIENVLLSVNIKEEKFDDQDNIKDDIICYIKNSRRTVQLRRLKYTVIYTSVACLFALVFTVASYNNSWVECIAHKGKHIANLPCGTVVSINSGSIIRFNKLDWLFHREIELNGEAQFDVTKGKKFTVNTKQGSISVLGTKFNVDTRNNDLLVECYEGSVSVKTSEGNVILSKNESLFYDGEAIYVDEVDKYNLNFVNTNLNNVLDQMSEIYKINYVRNYKHLDSLSFTGKLPKTNLEEAIEILSLSFGLEIEVNGSTLYVKANL